MKRTPALTAVIISGALLLSACAKGDDGDTTTAPQTVTTAASTTTTAPPTDAEGRTTAPMPTAWESPEIPEGISEEAAVRTAQRFLDGWAQFSPSNFEPKEYWFDSWKEHADSDFRQRMRVEADSMWSWTWNTSEKACCVEFPEEPEARVGQNTAVAKVTLTWRRQSVFATAAELEEQYKQPPEQDTYLVYMDARTDRYVVTDVEKVDADAPLPEVQ